MTLDTYEGLWDRVVIQPKEKAHETASGMLLGENDRKQDPIGMVIVVGTGVPLHNLKLTLEAPATPEVLDRLDALLDRIERGIPLKVKPGDMVHYGQHAGTKVKIDGQEYLIIREADIFGRWKPDAKETLSPDAPL